MNALFLASLNGHTEIVDMLLDRGAKPDSRETDGTICLMVNAREEIADSLIMKIYEGSKDFPNGGDQVIALLSNSENGELEAVKLFMDKRLIQRCLQIPIRLQHLYIPPAADI